MKSCLAVLCHVGLLLSTASWSAAPSDSDAMQIEPLPSALACLTPAPAGLPRPAYPAAALAAQQDAVLRVRLSFASAGEAPRVEIVHNSADEPFAQAVREQVAHYRVPCFVAGSAPLVATQEFQFVARRVQAPVFWGPVLELPNFAEQRRHEAFFKCLTPSRDVLAAGMNYPRDALRRGEFGNVVVRLKFAVPDAPPEVTVVYDAGSPLLAESVKRELKAMRAPCLVRGEPPVTALQTFRFAFEGDDTARREPELSLVEFLKLVKDLDQHSARFEFGTMACPFQLKLMLLQPHDRNRVGQVGAWNSNRVDVVEWLRDLPLDLPANAKRRLTGAHLIVTVACGSLDLL